MGTISRLKPQNAREQPASVFADPWQLVAEIAMTRGEKLAALRRWEQSVIDEMTAANEGMPPAEADGEQAALLTEIGKAILSLEGETPL